MPDVNFRDLLDFTSETVTRPKSAPDCWLIGVIGQLGGGEIPASEARPTPVPYLYFELNNIEAHPDNPSEILSELQGVDLAKLKSPFRRCLTVEFYMDDENRYHLANALDRIIGGRNRKARERVAEMQNQRVQFRVRRKTAEDGTDLGTNTVVRDSVIKATT